MQFSLWLRSIFTFLAINYLSFLIGVQCSRLLTCCIHRFVTETWHRRRTKSTQSGCVMQEIFQALLNLRYICDRRRQKKLLDSELTLICESARGLHEKKVLARTLLLSVHRAFAHARAFLLDKKKNDKS